MEKNLELIEEMLETLIQMVGGNNSKLDDLSQDIAQMKGDIASIKDGQVAKNSEAINAIIHGNNNNEHQFQAFTCD